MKLACVSDTHGKYEFLWPRADVLVIAGDFCPNFSNSIVSDSFIQAMWIEETFVKILAKLIKLEFYSDIVIIPGNHDRVFRYEKERAIEAIRSVSNVHMLIDEGVKIDGKLFWGSPWTPWFCGQHWVYNFPDWRDNPARARAHARNTWELIPKETNVLITHGPPYTILDTCEDGREVGCQYLADDVFKRIRPELHIFGHIHESYGTCERDGIKFVNACLCTLQYEPINEVRVVEI